MKDTLPHTHTDDRIPETERAVVSGRRGRSAIVVAACVVAGIPLLLAAAVTALTLWLTPGRLSALASREASRYLEADVRVSNLRFTLWSTWPRLCLAADSMRVESRALDRLPRSVREKAGAEARFLGSCGEFRGALNIPALLAGRVRLHDVTVGDLRLNLVSVNDTIGNYSIIPYVSDARRHVPEVSADRITLCGGGCVDYRSMASGFTAHMALDSLELAAAPQPDKGNLHGDGGDTRGMRLYGLRGAGLLDAEADGLRLLDGFPFHIGGDVAVGFRPLRVSFYDYSIALGSLRSHVSMDMAVGNDIEVDNFSYSVETFRLLGLLRYIPSPWRPDLDGLHTDVDVNLTARLLTPFRLNGSTLPSVEVDFDIPDGEFTYDIGKPLTARHIGMSGRFMFNGENPGASYVDIPGFSVESDGVRLKLEGRLDSLLEEQPRLMAHVGLECDAERMDTVFPAIRPYAPSGMIYGDVRLTCGVDRGPAECLRNLMLAGSVRVVAPSVHDGNMRLSADSLSLDFSTHADTVTPAGVSGLPFNGKLVLSSPVLDTPGFSLSLDNLCVAADVSSHRCRTASVDTRSIGYDDSVYLAARRHTPEALVLTAPESVRRIVGSHMADVSLSTDGGIMSVNGFGPHLAFGPAELRTNLDTVCLKRFSMKGAGSSLALSGSVSGVREALLSRFPKPLGVELDVDVDTLDINLMARALSMASGTRRQGAENDTLRISATRDAGSESDSVALLVPRNITARIALKARETVYTNLHLTGLSGEVRVSGGDLVIPGLTIGSSFGDASVTAAYRSSDIERMDMDLGLRLEDIELVTFFRKFHAIEEMMPSVRNLTGTVSAGLSVGMHVFPDMNIEMASVEGTADLSGRGLSLRQNRFIHHVLSMMMIHDRRPVGIDNVALHCSIHDNLLEVYPFDFDFSRYRLRIEGVNDFGGELDYHIGVERSPIPFRFGIEVEGTYHHPRLRFGRAEWSERHSQRITGDVMQSFTVNLVKELKWFGREFMHKAAGY